MPVALLTLALSFSLPALAAEAVSEAQLQEAQAAYKAGEFERALELAERFVEIDPAEPLYRVMVGQAREMLGRYDRALVAYRGGLAELEAIANWAADPYLKTLHQQTLTAIQRLEGRQQSAWLRVRGAEELTLAQIDGETVDASVELELPAGPHELCVVWAQGRRAACSKLTLQQARRLDVDAVPTSFASFGALIWAPMPGVQALTLDGAALGADPTRLEVLYATPGRRRVGALRPSGNVSVEIVLTAGGQLDLAEQLRRAALPVEGPAGAETGPGLAPWLVVGGGVLATIAGAVLLGLAEQDRAEVASADRTLGDDGAPGMTQRRAAELLDGAETMTWAGAALLGVGGGGILGGAVWGATSGEDE